MKAKLTRIHLGLGMGEVGVQFEIPDGAGGTVTQRAFVVVDDAAMAPVWGAAQKSLSEALDGLPLDLPPGNVAPALMRQRTAEAATQVAIQQLAEAQAQMQAEQQASAERCASLDAELEAKRAEAAKLDADMARIRAEAGIVP